MATTRELAFSLSLFCVCVCVFNPGAQGRGMLASLFMPRWGLGTGQTTGAVSADLGRAGLV